MLICHPVTSRLLFFPQKEAVLSACIFATTHLTASILNSHLPLTSRPMKWRTLSQRPSSRTKNRPKEEVFGTDIPRTSGGHSRGYSGSKLRSGDTAPRNSGKTSLLVRTSMTRRRGRPRPKEVSKKLRSEKLCAKFSFPTSERFRARQRSGEGVVRGNGRPKGVFWRVRFFSAPVRFALKTPENLKWEEKKRTLHPFGRPFLRTTPSPLLWRTQ